MIETLRAPRAHWRRLLPFAMLAVLGIAVVLPGAAPAIELSNPDRTAATGFAATLAALPDGAHVLVDMDADFGTYPEIRYATRAALADLLGQGASLAFVSYSPEGRAIAVAELERLRDTGTSSDRLLDLGYQAGAEAGLVLSVTALIPDEVSGPFAAALRSRGGGIDAFDLALVVAGSDMGPRSWIEQVETRLPQLTVAAIAPTFLRPELQPYLRSGQLSALLGTLRDGVAYGTDVAAAAGQLPLPEGPLSGRAMLIGMGIALLVLIQVNARGLVGALRRGRRRSAG